MFKRTRWAAACGGAVCAIAILGTTSSAAAAAAPAAGPSGYHVIKTIPVAGDGFWDYLTLDPATRRLFVSHATHVVVLDVDHGTVVGDIEDTPGVHGIVLAPEFNRGFATAGQAGKLVIFDLK